MYTRHRLMAITSSALLLAGTAASASAAATSPAPSTSLVVNVRIAGHCSFDRVVIDVKGKLPPTTVTRVKELRYDGSGKKVPLAGKRFLEIKLSPAAAHDNAGRNVYKGPRLIKLSLPKLKGFALTGDFEGVVTFGAAFDSKPSYTTKQLHRPERFVLDIAHHNTCRSSH
ncbi:hypothetical protein ACFW93_37415 [Streptomyces canus]|uniref:AMIN-like domain-containing (lipo)protein n=1 Tax=Streptomyces canus TaxID=58343 RepID=UPI00369CF655